MARVGPLLVASLLLNCSRDDNGTLPEVPKLSGIMVFTGQAEGNSEGLNVLCQCDMRLELGEVRYNADGSQLYEANLGGEITRIILDDNGNGFSFAPYLFGEAEVTVAQDNKVSVSWPANLDTRVRFYDEIALFEGVLNVECGVSGNWKCAPLDLNEGGYVDLMGTVAGIWELIGEE